MRTLLAVAVTACTLLATPAPAAEGIMFYTSHGIRARIIEEHRWERNASFGVAGVVAYENYRTGENSYRYYNTLCGNFNGGADTFIELTTPTGRSIYQQSVWEGQREPGGEAIRIASSIAGRCAR